MEKNKTEITKMKTQPLKLKTQTQWISCTTECTEEGMNELPDKKRK